MKTSSIPSLRVTENFRHDAESVLHQGESLSAFVEESLKRQIHYRKMQKTFIERGLAARDSAKASGQYADKEEVMASLHTLLEDAKSHHGI